MAQLPMWGPEPAKPGPPSASGGAWISPEELAMAEAPDPKYDLADLAAKFSAHSGGGLSKELSADLALEIVLNEIVEQACLATGASGAAIVLERDDEFVCRASTGANAFQLGARLDREAGLSGACVKTHQIQRCHDAQSDPRADIEACRQLGIRSVLILPLIRGNTLLGVFEVFSGRPSAFGERDERTLEALAQRALKNLQRASEPLVALPTPPPEVRPVEERLFASWERHADAIGGPYAVEESPRPARQFDVVILGLGAVVFACAVLLSTLMGLHFGRERAALAHARATRANESQPQKNLLSTNPAKLTAENSAATSNSESPAQNSTVQTGRSLPPAGGLMVYENGKEVFRMLPSADTINPAATDGGVQRASSVESAAPLAAEGGLLHRVEPEYPDEARRQGIQGPVVLDVHIAKDGAVQDVNLVSGQRILADAAASAVRQWRFRPHYAAGHEVEMQTRITLRFALASAQVPN
jgi:TonB family protein